MMRRALLISLACFFIGCGGGDDGAGGDAGDDPTGDGGAADTDGPPLGDGFTIEWGPVDVSPGSEDTRCVVKRLGNPDAMHVNTLYNYLGDVSHHLIVYRVSDTTEQTTPFACQPFADTLDPSKGAPIAVTQKSEETLQLPAGVGFSLAANQMFRLELHYVNASDEMKTVRATSTMFPMDEADFENEADFLFMGDVNVNIPANQSATLGPTYVPLPSDMNGANFFAVTGHEHQWGTGVTVEASAGNQPGTMVYDPAVFLWDEPETIYHEPPFQAPNNGGFRITCEWTNGSNSSVTFGEGANDEMCFFWGYYYPSVGSKVCFAHSGFGVTGCCPGNPLCSSFFP